MKETGSARCERRFMLVLCASILGLLCAAAVKAQETHQHQHELGKVNFTISCSVSAQKQFNRAVAWLHSFEYEEAEQAFTQVTFTDQKCGMGYWGIAMSNYHPLWALPTEDELKKGWAAIEKAKSVGGRTEREGVYIAAIEVIYKDAAELDHRARVMAYSEAMERLYRRYPKDREAAVFYALTLIATGMMANDKSYTNEKKAAEILNRVLDQEPEHPGVVHYLIHGYDYPPLAALALPAARSYAKIAPASAHAQHMPSHIFTRLGLWQEAIRSNLDAVSSANDWAKQVEVHRSTAAAWLALAEGKREEALQLMRATAELDDSTDKHPVTPGSLIPAREQLADLLLELKRPADALKEFETSLGNAPNRFNGVYGAAKAALALGDQRKAKAYFSQLLKLCPQADGNRPELAQAKESLVEK